MLDSEDPSPRDPPEEEEAELPSENLTRADDIPLLVEDTAPAANRLEDLAAA